MVLTGFYQPVKTGPVFTTLTLHAMPNELFSGVSCDTSLPPLCYRAVETTTTIEEECEQCPGDNSVTCNKWVDLADYENEPVSYDCVEICVEPCGAKTEPGTSAEMFCNVSSYHILGKFSPQFFIVSGNGR